MSINKFIIYFVNNKPFFLVDKIERPGFWIFELLVSIVILMLINLVLVKFSCNMMQLEADSVNRLRAIDCIASYLDAGHVKSQSFGSNMGNFDIKSGISEVCIVKSNLPESVKNLKNNSNFKISTVSVSFKSASGKENTIKILAKAPSEGGLHDM